MFRTAIAAFLILYFGIRIAGSFLSKRAQAHPTLGGVDRIVGVFVGAGRSLVLLGAIHLVIVAAMPGEKTPRWLAEAKLRALAHQVVRSQEEERAHLSRELHDGVSQTLVSTKLLIECAQQQGDSALLPRALERLNACLTEVRRLSHRLRPALLDNLGLAAALEHLAREFDAGEQGPQVQLRLQGQARALPELLNTVLFRVAQEALTNVAKHAGAARVELGLDFEPEGGVRLTVLDDGRGFDAEAVQAEPEQGIGLRNMRERLASVGGTLELQSRPGHGSQVEAHVPAAALARLARDNA